MAAASIRCANIWSRRSSCRAELMWHKWEAYSTWISGFSLLVLGLLSRRRSLPDRSRGARVVAAGRRPRSASAALALGWLVYDIAVSSRRSAKTRSGAGRGRLRLHHGAWRCSSSRCSPAAARCIHTGALMATIMTGNVFINIIPNHEDRGRRSASPAARPIPNYGKQAKTRSTHNNYLTLPVLFLMISGPLPDDVHVALCVGDRRLRPDRRRAGALLLQPAACGQRRTNGGPGASRRLCMLVVDLAVDAHQSDRA